MADKSTPVPESQLKKRNAIALQKAKAAAHRIADRKRNAAKRRDIFNRAEKYAREYKKRETALVNFRREAKATGKYYKEPEAKIAVVVRIRGINGVSPKVRKILQLLRLRQIHNAVFVRLNSAVQKMLTLVGPYIAYGYPNLKTVKELIYKRGFGKVDKQRVALTDNSIVEKALGKFNIVCVEDLVHEIYTCGANFKEANNFLWPFHLSSATGGFSKKKLHFNDGGDAGNSEVKINNLVQRML